jgi:viroplasmin and RNaseH domain-containing protein
VFDGHEPGVYYNWPDYHRQVHMFRGACYKKYNSKEGIVAFKSRTNSNLALSHDDDFYLQNPIAAPPSSPSKLV